MQIVRYNPFRELQSAERDLDKLWQNGWGLLPSFSETSVMDMYEENGNLVAEVNLPNFKKDEVTVTTDAGILEVSAEHQEKEENKSRRRYLLRESSNRYLRRVTLPEGVKTDTVEASFKDGVLKVTMPMAAPKQAKKVAIK